MAMKASTMRPRCGSSWTLPRWTQTWPTCGAATWHLSNTYENYQTPRFALNGGNASATANGVVPHSPRSTIQTRNNKPSSAKTKPVSYGSRSEERRVGKELRVLSERKDVEKI